jgi:hypothetical protein
VRHSHKRTDEGKRTRREKMANARRIPAQPQPDDRDVELRLSSFEASVLRRVLGAIGGTPGKGTPRSALDAISDALIEADVKPLDVAFRPNLDTIYFP